MTDEKDKNGQEKHSYERRAGWQVQQLNDAYPHLRAEDFSSEGEYKNALIEQYRSLREDEYKAICYNTGLEMYRDSMAVICYTHDKSAMNTHIWNGLKSIPETVVPKDSVARRVPEHVMYQYANSGSRDKHSCAITGSVLVETVCDRMGCEDNMVHFAGEAGKIINPEDFQYWHTGAGHFMFDPQAKGYTGKGNMAELIVKGTIGPGDRISSSTGSGATNSTTGKHERTVISVEKDDNGRVTGYVIQANNNAELSYHKISDKYDYLNNAQVEYASTESWIRNQINNECLNMQNMSVQEIQEQINTTKQKTADVLTDTTTEKERYLIEGDINPKFSEHCSDVYAADFKKHREQEHEMLCQIRQDLEKYKDIMGNIKVVSTQNESLKLAGLEDRYLQTTENAINEQAEISTPDARASSGQQEVDVKVSEKELSDAEKVTALRGLGKKEATPTESNGERIEYTQEQIRAMQAMREGGNLGA